MYKNSPGHMTKMAATPIHSKTNTLKHLFLRNWWTDFKETWHEALVTQVLQCIYRSCPCDDLDLLVSKVNIGRLWGKLLECQSKEKLAGNVAEGLNTNDP